MIALYHEERKMLPLRLNMKIDTERKGDSIYRLREPICLRMGKRGLHWQSFIKSLVALNMCIGIFSFEFVVVY